MICRPFQSVITAAALVAGLGAVAASAQDEAAFVEAFSGEWLTLDPALSADGTVPCRVALTGERESEGGPYGIATEGCSGALNALAGWAIVEGQLALTDASGTLQATLGGNQNRMTGDLMGSDGPDRALVLERVGTERAAFVPQELANGACLYIGYTASCAEPSALMDLASTTESEETTISVLVNLNARAEPRPDAAVVDIVPKQTCLAVSQCVDASDGRWCEARIGQDMGWMRQQAVRGGQWPVLTYQGGC